MRKSPDSKKTTTTLPSLSSSVSSASSLSTATAPNHDRLHNQEHHHRQTLPPQRSASAGALMRHPQHQHFRHSSATATTTTPLRPASWGNERAMSFHHFEDPSHLHHQSFMNALFQQQHQQDRWDDSQLAMELAEDDLIDESIRRRSSARRIKQKLMKSISRQSFDLGSHDGIGELPTTTASSSSASGAAIIPSSSANRIARSFKRLTSILF